MNTLLEINLLLSLVYLGYYLLLRNLTFFQWTRLYLLFGMLASVLYPLLRANAVVQVPAEAIAIQVPLLTLPYQTWDWETWAMYGVLGISALYLLRLLFQLGALRNIHLQTQKARFEDYEYQDSNKEIKPFSFLKWIYIYSEGHSQKELIQILKHEKIHVRAWHTLDVLVAEFCRILCWYNPVVLWLNRAVKDNLEYGVDHRLIHTGIDKVSYQHSLVGIALNRVPHPYPGNEFAFKTLKRRILMMNRHPSHRIRLFTYAVLVPALFIGCVFLNVSCQKENLDRAVKPQSIGTLKTDSTVITVEGRPILGQKRTKLPAEKEEITVVGRPAKDRPTVIGFPVVVEGKEVVSEGAMPSREAPMTGQIKENSSYKTVVGRPYFEKPQPANGASNIVVEGKLVEGEGNAKVEGRVIEVEGMPVKPNTPKFIIRGNSSTPPERQPLIILDDVQVENLNDINPDQIQSISVLKGESAEKTYGAKAKNGVIVILSKSSTRH